MAERFAARKQVASGPYRRMMLASAAVLTTCAAAFLVYSDRGLGWGRESLPAGETRNATLSSPASSPYAAARQAQPALPIAEPEKKAALLASLGNATLRFNVFSGVVDQKISDLHLESAFSPDALVSSAKLSESFQKITGLQELQRQSAEAKNAYFSDVESTIKSSGLSASTIDAQMTVFKTSREESIRLDDELRGLESQTTKSAVAILNFAQRELGTSSLQDGQVVFRNPAQEEYQRLMGDLVRSSTAQNKASVRISELQQKHKNMLDSGFRR